MPPPEDYIAPVGFAREPHVERKRWISRILLFAFVAVLAWLLMYRVIYPQDDQAPRPQRTNLPAPI